MIAKRTKIMMLCTLLSLFYDSGGENITLVPVYQTNCTEGLIAGKDQWKFKGVIILNENKRVFIEIKPDDPASGYDIICSFNTLDCNTTAPPCNCKQIAEYKFEFEVNGIAQEKYSQGTIIAHFPDASIGAISAENKLPKIFVLKLPVTTNQLPMCNQTIRIDAECQNPPKPITIEISLDNITLKEERNSTLSVKIKNIKETVCSEEFPVFQCLSEIHCPKCETQNVCDCEIHCYLVGAAIVVGVIGLLIALFVHIRSINVVYTHQVLKPVLVDIDRTKKSRMLPLIYYGLKPKKNNTRSKLVNVSTANEDVKLIPAAHKESEENATKELVKENNTRSKLVNVLTAHENDELLSAAHKKSEENATKELVKKEDISVQIKLSLFRRILPKPKKTYEVTVSEIKKILLKDFTKQELGDYELLLVKNVDTSAKSETITTDDSDAVISYIDQLSTDYTIVLQNKSKKVNM